MDPIKVDFTKKKDDGIIIKPAKAGLKIFLNILITLVGAGIAYYIMLPPMNFKSTDMYIFFVIVALISPHSAGLLPQGLRPLYRREPRHPAPSPGHVQRRPGPKDHPGGLRLPSALRL